MKNDAENKGIQRELALTIRENANVVNKTKEATKQTEKLSQQLNSKLERLNTQYKHNSQLNAQLKKVEDAKQSQKQVKLHNQFLLPTPSLFSLASSRTTGSRIFQHTAAAAAYSQRSTANPNG